METLKKALTLEQLKAKKDKKGFIKANVQFTLGELIDNDIEWLNDEASERITTSVGGLTDISYSPVGISKENIIIEVTGNVIDFIEGEEERLENEEDN